METVRKNQLLDAENHGSRRREFIKKGVLLGTLTGVAGMGLVAGCKGNSEEEVTPSEDLMREHGILNRILLIYDSCRVRLVNNEAFDPAILNDSAQIIRTFIEDYHEMLEEKYLFPLFTDKNKYVELIQILSIQHKAGRTLTDQIIEYLNAKTAGTAEESQRLAKLLEDFSGMYRPHEAWEDTVLFPAIRKTVTGSEYHALGKDFENKEHELFGEDGFDRMVAKVADLERKQGIYELSRFTPTV